MTGDRQRVQAFTDEGYKLVERLADTDPTLIRSGDRAAVVDALERLNREQNTRRPPAIFDENRTWAPDGPFPAGGDAPNRGGPSHDDVAAFQIWEALPQAKRSHMSDRRVLAAINCLSLGSYPDIRWKSSKKLWSSDDPDVRTKFVVNHWLGYSKESNTAARLWWLYEYARSAGEHSEHPTDVLLSTMADNVNFYHPLLKHPYLMASDWIRAAVLDVSIRRGLAQKNNTSETNRMLRALNQLAGAISLDILDNDALRDRIERVMPPKAGGVRTPRS